MAEICGCPQADLKVNTDALRGDSRFEEIAPSLAHAFITPR